jgi:hypothetical protein
VFARQPCYPIPPPRDVGQWLCVPPFRVVCLCQASRCPFHSAFSAAMKVNALHYFARGVPVSIREGS